MRDRASYFREYRAKRSASRAEGGLLPFQAAFVKAVCRKEMPVDIAALSVPRGNGKSWLCGKLVARSISPGDPLFDEGVENVLVAASRPQAGIVLEFARSALGESEDYRWRIDGVVHTPGHPDAGKGHQLRLTPCIRARRERADSDCR